jgi:hypothetical protein
LFSEHGDSLVKTRLRPQPFLDLKSMGVMSRVRIAQVFGRPVE